MDDAARLTRNLRQLGVLQTQRVEDALNALEPAAFVRHELLPFAHLDIPWPDRDGTDFTISPRLSALLAELLAPEPGDRVLLVPKAPRLLSAILDAMDAVVVTESDGACERALVVDGNWDLEDAARHAVVEDGHLIRVRLDAFGENLVKYVRTDGDWVRMGLKNLRLEPEASLRPGHEAKGEPLENLLIVEGIERRVWNEALERHEDAVFHDAVERVWAPCDQPELDEPDERRLLARKFFHLAYVNQGVGDLANAIDLYTASLDAYPTAEAYTFRSWTFSILGEIDEAIDGCKKAIQVDPEFGNPYNDIGAYLLEKGEAGQALPWLEKAKHARRYEAPHFAHTNAGRAHLLLGHTEKARREFETALAIDPDYEPARHLLALMDRDDFGPTS